MQEPRSNSTLELVVNEQQFQNMSQIDLSGPCDNNMNQPQQQHQQQQPPLAVPQLNHLQQQQNDQRRQQQTDGFNLQQLKEWPIRFRNSFNAKIDEAKSRSETKAEFILEILHAFSGFMIWILCFLFTIIVPVILFFIGLLNLDNCNDRPALPYLVFAIGFVMTASNLFNLALSINLPILSNHQILTSDIKNTISSIVNIIFNCVVAFLYILCGYMVYTVGLGGKKPTVAPPQPNSSPANINKRFANEEDYQDGEPTIAQATDCGTLLYYFTFWFITLTLSLIVGLSLIACAFYAYNRYRIAIVRGSTPRSQTNINASSLNVNINPSIATNGV